jgi:prolyl 4-hydroxylase
MCADGEERYIFIIDSSLSFQSSSQQRFAANGGQRIVTVLIYLNDVAQGGHTRFPALNLEVQPREGMALIFFPATIDGLLDKMALHAAMPAIDTKYVSQVWIRQSTYNGMPSKRLATTMGPPL